jgi:hypothetical protein
MLPTVPVGTAYAYYCSNSVIRTCQIGRLSGYFFLSRLPFRLYDQEKDDERCNNQGDKQTDIKIYQPAE